MTTVPPPTTPPLPAAVPAPAAPVLLILAPPAAVAALPAGATLEGVVLPPPPQAPAAADADARNVVTIRTPQGDVTLRLPAPLPPGSEVELQVVRTTTDQTTVRLLAVDDQPAAQVLAQLRQAATNAPLPQPALPQTPLPAIAAPLPPVSAWTPQGPVALPSLGTLSAYVIQATPTPGIVAPPQLAPGPAMTPPVFALTTGGELAVRVTAVQLPPPDAATPVPPPIPPLVVTAAPATAPASLLAQAIPPVIPATAAAVPPLAVAAPPSITPVPVSPSPPIIDTPVMATPAPPAPQPAVIVAGPQGLPSPPPTPPVVTLSEPPQAVLTGVVTRGAANTPPMIATDLGEIQLNVRANLPVGTRVTLEIAMQLPPEPGSAPPPLPLAVLPLTGPPSGGTTVGWPNLSEALVQLNRADPAAAAQFAAAIPDGGPRTTVAIIAFAQAMRSGDSRAWPGDANLRALESIGPRGAHLARQIGDEVKALATRAADTGGGEWRALPMPWNADGRIDRIALITRREGDADDTNGGKKGRGGGTRFLLNLDLSRLGPLQLDGMFRKDTRGFDLMIRTKQPLSEALRLELTGIFGTSTAAMGLKGGLTFQVVREFRDPLGSQPADKSGLWA